MVPSEPLSPYLTLYPLPSGSFYVVAKTWLDASASRTGCVLTHSLLVPMDQWATLPDLTSVVALHRRPERAELRAFGAPLMLGRGTQPTSIHDPHCDDFIAKFFGEGIRPLVWFGVRESEAYVLRIAASLWPSIRRGFACCSCALQPRALDERPFDLMFAPAAARSRFVELQATNIVSADAELHPSKPTLEPWAREWRDIVFEGDTRDQHLASLAAGLDATPTAIRKVFLFVELQERAASVPLAAIGALDVLEGLGGSEIQARGLVSMLVTRALDSVRGAPAQWVLEMLCLLGLRLDRVESSLVEAQVYEAMSSATLDCVSEDLPGAIALAERFSTRDMGRLPRSLMRGLAEALAQQPTAQALQTLARAHHVGRNLVEVSPESMRTLLVAGRRDGVGFADVLTDWYQAARDPAARSALRMNLVPLLSANGEAALLQELLKDINQGEVARLCADGGMQTVAPELGRLFAEYVGEVWPAEVLSSTQGGRMDRSSALAFMVAGALPLDPSGLEQARGLNVVAAFVDRALHRAPPAWLVHACESGDVWRVLLSAANDTFASSVLARLVTTIDRSGIARTAECLSLISHAAPIVQTYAARQLLLDQMSADSCTEDAAKWLGTEWCAQVIVRDASFLRTVIGDEISSNPDAVSAWVASWRIVELVSRTVVPAAGSVVEVCDLLLWRRPWPWPVSATPLWCSVLMNLSRDPTRHDVACTQAVKFCLENPRLPVAPVVAEAFFTVHAAALRSQSRPSWDFLGFTTWDKAGELRRRLVDAFHYGEWPPEWFVIAARERSLLRKLCKRMMKLWRGTAFLERALGNLGPGVPRDELIQILEHPDFDEEWE